MRWIKSVGLILAVFAPFILVGYALAIVPNTWQVIQSFSPMDWTWLTMLGLMMVGVYYFLAVYLEDEDEIELDFQRMDTDHDGYLRRADIGNATRLATEFEHFDGDHDGKLSRVDFENFQHADLR